MIRKNKDWPFWIFLTIIAILGILTLRQYGESWDELRFYRYANLALEAYSTWPARGEIPVFGNTYDNYGPAYSMGVILITRALQFILPGWLISDLRHLIYFFTYLAGIWAFHNIAKRWFSQAAALGAALLFSTQPIFWGHAFMSPKDMPFLSFFLLSIDSGLRLVDSLGPFSLDSPAPRIRRKLLVLSALWLVTIFGLFVATPLFHAWIESLVNAASAGRTNIISMISSDIRTAAPEVYVQKFFMLFLQVRAVFFWVSLASLAWIYWPKFSGAFRILLSIAPAAIILGLTISIRILGPLAGLLVALYAFRKHGRQSFPSLILYGAIALIVMYAVWPYLWLDPVGHLLESAKVMSQYPWNGMVLFNGTEHPSADLPRSYLPVLLGIQFTEPVWVLFMIGLAAAVFGFIKKREESRQLLILLAIWFLLPLAGLIITKSPLYDNFRQVLFILPPVFIIAGLAFEKIEHKWLQAAVTVLCVLPGIMDGIRLHPYEYIYYNRFIGGVNGAFRRFELDYWGLSFREAAGWLNQNAPANVNIWVEGPTQTLEPYLRTDIKIYSDNEPERADEYEYVVLLTRYNLDLTTYPTAKIVHTIERGHAVLTVIRQP